MKKILAAAVFVLGATSAVAGNLAYVAPEAMGIEEPAMMGGSGAWLIPLVIVAVLALALTADDDCNRSSNALSVSDPCSE